MDEINIEAQPIHIKDLFKKRVQEAIIDLKDTDIDENDTISLFHGTASRYLNDILMYGLLPRKEGGHHNWENAPSFEELTYLTNKWHYHYAWNSAMMVQKEYGEGNFPCYVEFAVPKAMLTIDEDFLSTKYVADKLKRQIKKQNQTGIQASFDLTWEESLSHCGAVGHFGSIDPKYIVSFTILGEPNFLRNILIDKNSGYAKDVKKWMAGKGKGNNFKLIDLWNEEAKSNRNATFFIKNIGRTVIIKDIIYNEEKDKTQIFFDNLTPETRTKDINNVMGDMMDQLIKTGHEVQQKKF